MVGGLPLSDGQRVSTLNGRGYTDWYLLGDSIGSLQLGVDGRGSGNIAALVAMQGVIPIDGGCVEADLPSAEGGTGARPGADRAAQRDRENIRENGAVERTRYLDHLLQHALRRVLDDEEGTRP